MADKISRLIGPPRRGSRLWDLRRRAAKELLELSAPEAMMRRFSEMRRIHKLSWNQRRLARRDIVRLIDGMIAAKWVEASDRDAADCRDEEETTTHNAAPLAAVSALVSASSSK